MVKRLITGGHVVDPANDVNEIRELLIEGEKITATGKTLGVRRGEAEILDAAGRIVIPGLVDCHTHISSGREGYTMLARAGVTTTLDLNGDPLAMADGIRSAGTGLTAGFLYPLIPGQTISGRTPDRAELREVIARASAEGAFGVKIVGGHYPLTPEATRRAVNVAHELGVYRAIHAGTTERGSNLDGLAELLELLGGLPAHVAHINSYCRGQVTGDPVEEAVIALKLLRQAPNVRSESYLGLINGTSALFAEGLPRSAVTRTCLEKGGYRADPEGMDAAIRDGWAKAHGPAGDEQVLLEPEAGLAAFRNNQVTSVSFAVNSPAAGIALATARHEDGRFIVDAISTDGGRIPRNTALRQGLGLVQYGALTLSELILKTCRTPAEMLGLPHKGHLGAGADADVVLFECSAATPETVIARGTIVVQKGELLRQKACLRFPLPL